MDKKEQEQWQEFMNSGLFWWINMLLHTFGWSIFIESDKDNILKVYPKRCDFRGFPVESNTDGYKKLQKYLKDNIDNIEKDNHNK